MTETIRNYHELIESRKWKSLKLEINKLEPVKIAEIIEGLPGSEDIIIFRLLSGKRAKETFHHLSHEGQQKIIKVIVQNTARIASLMNDLEPDDRTAFLEELPKEITRRLIQHLSPEERKIATQLLGYPEDSIGRLMTPEYVTVKPDYTVKQALDHIQKHGSDSETLDVIYVVDEKGKLIDDITIREIILAKPDRTIAEIMDSHFVALSALDDQEKAIRIFRDQDRVALPVIDSGGYCWASLPLMM